MCWNALLDSKTMKSEGRRFVEMPIPNYITDFIVLESNKAFWRESSFCSSRWALLQNEDPTDFFALESNKPFQHVFFPCSFN